MKNDRTWYVHSRDITTITMITSFMNSGHIDSCTKLKAGQKQDSHQNQTGIHELSFNLNDSKFKISLLAGRLVGRNRY